MKIKIRPITTEDLPLLQELSEATFRDTFAPYNSPQNIELYITNAYNSEKLTAELLNNNSAFFFIYYDDRLAGYLKINVETAQTEEMGPNTLEVQRIYILSQFKRLGLGSQLIDKAISVAIQKSKQAIWLGVWEDNFSALSFYKDNGFKEVDVHIFHMGKRRQRDLILRKEITSSETNNE